MAGAIGGSILRGCEKSSRTAKPSDQASRTPLRTGPGGVPTLLHCGKEPEIGGRGGFEARARPEMKRVGNLGRQDADPTALQNGKNSMVYFCSATKIDHVFARGATGQAAPQAPLLRTVQTC